MISAVLLTKNEGENIEECIEALRFCNEILVVDDNSTDRTCEIAKKLGARVVSRKLEGDFAAQSNFAITQVKYEWVLFVDADERISEFLSRDIVMATKSSEYKVYTFRRKDYIWGKWLTHGEVGGFRSIRLIKKGSGKWVRSVHQYFKTDELIGELKSPILHYPHNTLRKFIKNIDKWSSWHALANKEEGKTSNMLKICFYPIGHFVKNYVIKLGFMDGIEGLVFALVMAGHSYLSWSKQWLLQRGSTKIQEDF